MQLKEILPVVVALVIGAFVSFHAFSERPSVDELLAYQQGYEEQAAAYLPTFEALGFAGTVTFVKSFTLHEPRRNTRYRATFDLVGEAQVPAQDTAMGEKLYHFEGEASYFFLDSEQGRFIEKGDSLVKNVGEPHYYVYRRNSERIDTFQLSWRLFQ